MSNNLYTSEGAHARQIWAGKSLSWGQHFCHKSNFFLISVAEVCVYRKHYFSSIGQVSFLKCSLCFAKGPVTLLRIVLAYASVWKISLIRCYTLTYARGTLGIGCIRFKHGRVRWHTLAYGEAEHFFKHVQQFCAYRTYALYDKHTLGTRWIR
jgi:predicted Fe-S protein YdhL (DUF1289 family)